MSSFARSSIFFKKEDIPKLIANVVKHKELAQTNFIEAIPLILNSMDSESVRTQLIPFIKNWVNFGDRECATLFTSFLPLFMPPNHPPDIFFSLLFLVNNIIRQSAMFIEKELMEVCKVIGDVFDIDSIQTYILPSLDQLFIPCNTDSQGLALLVQAFFIPLVSNNWRDKITKRIIDLAGSDSTYIRVCVLKTLNQIISISDNPSELIHSLLLPKFDDFDFKVRTTAIATAASIGYAFFVEEECVNTFLKNADDESWYVRFAFVHHLKEAIKAAPNKDPFFDPLLKLTYDKVVHIHLMALNVLTDVVQFFPTEFFADIKIIFDLGMKSPQDDIRSAVIDLWASLLKHHPNGEFHSALYSTLNLISVLPIESVIYHMMYQVIPLVPHDHINEQTLLKGIHTLLESITSNWEIAGMHVIKIYSQVPNLRNLALQMVPLVFTLIDSPSFAVRCSVGEVIVDFSLTYSWDWFTKEAYSIIENCALHGNSLVKQSISRTIVELLHNKPPKPIRKNLSKWLKLIEKNDIPNVSETAEYSHSILSQVESHVDP